MLGRHTDAARLGLWYSDDVMAPSSSFIVWWWRSDLSGVSGIMSQLPIHPFSLNLRLFLLKVRGHWSISQSVSHLRPSKFLLFRKCKETALNSPATTAAQNHTRQSDPNQKSKQSDPMKNFRAALCVCGLGSCWPGRWTSEWCVCVPCCSCS